MSLSFPLTKEPIISPAPIPIIAKQALDVLSASETVGPMDLASIGIRSPAYTAMLIPAKKIIGANFKNLGVIKNLAISTKG